MNRLRYIFDKSRDAAMNMAIDEMFFEYSKDEPVLRIYFWDKAYCTIGYFQKNPGNAIRRLTGGLLVNHKTDLSYGLCVSDKHWHWIYNQTETYKQLHRAIKNALSSINIETNFAHNTAKQFGQKNILCVQTVYEDDLMLNGIKIAGSCMRRRGKRILAQGSVHMDFDDEQKEKFAAFFAKGISDIIGSQIKKLPLSEYETEKALTIAKGKYSNKNWNFKF